MQDDSSRSSRLLLRHFRLFISEQFNIRNDQASYAEIDNDIRGMVDLRGTNLWVLMFAIIVASVGLNVNSTAVIIGAMLISPLMGPIMGIGYGIGIYDFDLIKRSFRSIAFAAGISVLSATLYFLVTPLSEARSELLARTTPTLWDVLIALFGGLAGILAVTRQEKSNVIPGVAIATALMPPLCTAGYGLANWHLSYFFGAIYLFFINLVFIALATVMFISYIKPPHRRFVDAVLEKRVYKYIAALVMITVLPSIYLAYNMVSEETFNSRAREFVRKELAFEHTLATNLKIEPEQHRIEVTLMGEQIPDKELAAIRKRMPQYGLPHATLLVQQQGEQKIDMASLKAGLLRDLYENSQKRIQNLEQELSQSRAAQIDGQHIARELAAQYPQVRNVVLAQSPVWQPDGTSRASMLVVYVTAKSRLSAADSKRIKAWLAVRTKTPDIKLMVNVVIPHKGKSHGGSKPAAQKPSQKKGKT